ncbi:LuxR C-terminal-related transcriptional regulator [Pseudomonas sp. B21-012]|uniref:LuxR C-terminal-related transcriptional regulator n=1 Tax=unclassified Pseudomonas TaxID=196821 RepID=UPI001BCCEF57|nr:MULTISPECIES: LuxR C-terminal-related transcriptional regulator [unclassified Pseudomonas]QVM99006.1 PAS domain S-box protein [Pseudomonas sp. SORT22]UVL54124.1 LuxR C-terminal-related transcriptional regulator [Pseudomonas sp. B21-035]UVM53669.1 LuxR C-terminal-related transcriptional regulator [Pseudomonas sp. B21-012]
MIEDAPHFQDLERLAFQVSPAPQMITGHRRMLDCNQAFERLFGYEREHLQGNLTLLLYPSHADYQSIGERSEHWLRNGPGAFYSDERFMQHRNGEVFWARAHGFSLTVEDPFKLMVWHFERLDRQPAPTIQLTPREREISLHIVNGLTCKEVARKLGISHRTVEVHRARLMKKLQAKNSAELVSKIIFIS